MANPLNPTNSRTDEPTDLSVGRRALELAASALSQAASALDDNFARAVEGLFLTQGKIIVTGVGKSAHIAAKIAATLNSTGTSAMFMHAGEAMHGDVGAVNERDAVLCLSKSGSSDEVVALLPVLKQRDCTLVAMTAKHSSQLGQAADVLLDLGVSEEACPFDLAPTTSTSLQLALGDALAMALMNRKGFQPDDFAKNHPAGALGKKLTWTLGQLVDPERRPAVVWDASLPDVLKAMSDARYGATVVWAEGREGDVAGIVTDGDLRRAMVEGQLKSATAGDIASMSPKTLDAETLAAKAAHWMQDQKISQVIVMKDGAYLGMVHLHDCLREGLV